ncbi:MAG: hypothetical protein IJP01_02285, partial [Oscillospiraceae bacterium]|nr:hypothetical protein [Oscillospiraceae bacterium]
MKRMYKQMAALFLLLALLLTGCSGGGKNKPTTPPQPDAAEVALQQLQSKLQAEDAVMGVAYLGGFFDEEDPDLQDTFEARGLLEEFPFLEDIDENDD